MPPNPDTTSASPIALTTPSRMLRDLTIRPARSLRRLKWIAAPSAIGRRRLVNRLLVFVIAVCLAGAAARAAAQDTTGTIAGRIVDAQGLAIPGVTVTAVGAQGARTAVTDGEGRYTVPFLTPGSYAVHARIDGFKPIERSDVQVRLGQTV